jgi:distribution and morphology protein 31
MFVMNSCLSSVATNIQMQSRLRIDGVNTDHIFRRVEGPPGWISSGQVDVSADIYIPTEATTADSTELLRKLVYEIADKIELPQPVVLGTGNGEDEIVIGAHKSEEQHKQKASGSKIRRLISRSKRQS